MGRKSDVAVEDGAARQTEVPGSDKDRIQEIENAGREFRNANEAWKTAGEERAEAQAELLKAMHENRKKRYRLKTGDLVELVVSSEKVRIVKADTE